MKNKLRIVIVGCGQIADGHVEEIQKIETAELVAVCDLEPILAEQLAARYQVPQHFSDFDQMLDSVKPDVVHICTPPASHLPLLMAAVAAGAHVYVEKPLALDANEAQQMVSAVQAAGLKMTIGHIHHFDPIAERARNLVADGAIGDVVHVESWFGYSLAGSFGKLILGSPDHWVHRLPGGLLQNNINHLLHKIVEYLPDESPQISVLGWRAGTHQQFGDARDRLIDELRVCIRGETVSGQGTFTAKSRPVGNSQRIYGTKASLHLDYNNRMIRLDRGVVLPSAIGRLTSGWTQARVNLASALRNSWHFATNRFHYFAGMNTLMRRFYHAILHDTEPPIPVNDILRTTRIMDEIFVRIEDQSR